MSVRTFREPMVSEVTDVSLLTVPPQSGKNPPATVSRPRKLKQAIFGAPFPTRSSCYGGEQSSPKKGCSDINIVKSSLGVFDSSSVDFLEMLQDLKFGKTCRHYVVKKIMAIAVRTLYYVFCRRNKDWENPELMTL